MKKVHSLLQFPILRTRSRLWVFFAAVELAAALVEYGMKKSVLIPASAITTLVHLASVALEAGVPVVVVTNNWFDFRYIEVDCM